MDNNIPVQMIFATDTDGKIIEKVKQKSAKNTIGQTFINSIFDEWTIEVERELFANTLLLFVFVLYLLFVL